MKKQTKKLVNLAITALFAALLLAPLHNAFAQEAPAADTATADADTPIPGDPCVAHDPDNPDLRLQVVIEESFNPQKNNEPEKYGENTEVRTCYRVTRCKIEEVDDTFLNFLKKESQQKIKKPVCRTELKKTCDNEYQQGFNEIDEEKGEGESKYCQRVQVILTDQGGAGLLYVYVGTIYKWAASIVGIITVLLIVINGIIISASAGDTQAVTNAKTRIMQSLAALVILFLSGLILNTINPNFFT